MSKYGPCHFNTPGFTAPCARTAAWLKTNPAGNLLLVCKAHLDWKFDDADGGSSEEPLGWGWLDEPSPSPTAVAMWASAPCNHAAVAEVLRREARINPSWLRAFLDREDRMHGGRGPLVPR